MDDTNLPGSSKGRFVIPGAGLLRHLTEPPVEGLPLPSPEEQTALASVKGVPAWATSAAIREDLFMMPNQAAEKHRQLTSSGSYLMWFVQAPDLAYDGQVVAWAKIADPQGSVCLAGELVGDRLEAVRAMLPPGRAPVEELDV